ncbi:MAG: DUF5985 family protein [Gemmatimonadaceae bacterium]
MTGVSSLVSGALVMGYLVAATFFLRFSRRTGDRLFTFFSVAFVLLAVHRLALALVTDVAANAIWLYVLRLLAFLIILAAIADKNRAARHSS